MRRMLLGISGVAVALLVSGDHRPIRVARAADPGSRRRLEDALAEREYEASSTGQGLQAPNRAQNLRTYFEPTGIRVVDRTAPGTPPLASLTLSGVGRGAALATVLPGEVAPAGARVEIRRAGLTEWYENSPGGLEQGFTLRDRPDGAGELALELALADAEPALSGGDLVLRASSGRKLRYANLRAVDAAGRALPARFELAAPKVRLVVDDASATYPIAIDPTLTQSPDTTIQGNQSGDGLAPYLGSSLASAGDVNGDGYDDLIIGAPLYDLGMANSGLALIYLGGPNGIPDGDPNTAATRLTSTQSFSSFGSSVASAGDVNGDGYDDVIVGAPFFDDGELNEGAAFIFLGGPAGIPSGDQSTAATELQGNQVEDPNFVGGAFASCVASAGDVNADGYDDVIVSSNHYAGAHLGAAWIFLGGPTGVANGNPSTAATRLTPTADGGVLSGNFGSGAASAGDVNGDGYDDVIVSEPILSSAFVFLGGPSGIPDATTDTAQTRLVGGVGSTVAGAGDVNGDGYADIITGNGPADAAYVFLGGSSGIPNGSSATASATLTSTVAGSGFGGSFEDPLLPFVRGQVAGAGDVNGDGYADVIVSAVSYPSSPGGVAFVFFGSATGVHSQNELAASLTLPTTGTANGTNFASTVAGAGDVNGDGFADILIGQSPFSRGEANEGAAFLYLGGSATPTATVISNGRIDGNQAGSQLGVSVASAGDVNGDGFADVIVGAPTFDSGETDEGAAFVFLGGPAGITPAALGSAAAVLQSDYANAQLGGSVASAGDVNGDGFADVIVGASGYGGNGAAFVFLGSASGVASGSPATAHARLVSSQASSLFGISVASAGDVNGDGRSDVIVGAPFYSLGESHEGAAFVFDSGPTGLVDAGPATASATLQSNSAGALLGIAVSSAGDVNGDGFADVIVGASSYSPGGIAAIYRGSATGIPSGGLGAAATLITGSDASSQFGGYVAGAGDLNGDGFDDVAVSAPSASKAFVFTGGASMPAALASSSATTTFMPFFLPLTNVRGVAGVGDVNGDGFADLVLSEGPAASGTHVLLFTGSAALPSSGFGQLYSSGVASFGYSVAGAGDVNGDGFADVIAGAPSAVDGSSNAVGAAYILLGGATNGRPALVRQLRGDGSGVPVQPFGNALHADGFVAQLAAEHPAGRGRVRVEVQTCPEAHVFGAVDCTSALSAWQTVGPGSLSPAVPVVVSGLSSASRFHWRARVQRADDTGALPSRPAHGPWRRLSGQPTALEIRTADPFNDPDLDGVASALDDCDFRADPGQQDTGGLGSGSGADGIGDVCQCGNVAGSGAVDAADVAAYRLALANPAGAPLAPAAVSRCTVLGSGTACNVLQVSVIRRGIHVPPLAPLTSAAAAQVCAATHP